MFGLGMNNNGTGLVLASMALADHSRVLLLIIFYNLVQHLVAGAVDIFLTRRPSRLLPERASVSVEFLMDYLDGVLADPVRLRFEEHLQECPDCVAYLATYREAVRLGKDTCRDKHESLPEDVPEELVRAILQACRQDAG
jgi:hypothetical protein